MKWIGRILSLLALLAVVACGQGKQPEKESDTAKTYLPKVSGKPGDLLIVIDHESWNSEVGTLLRDVLAADYPLLPQREPYFTLYNVPHNAFSGSFYLHRNILVLNLGKKESTVQCQQNTWAAPQAVVQVNARDREDALSLLQEEGKKILDFFESFERNRAIASNRKFNDVSVQTEVMGRLGGAPVYPNGFSLKSLREDFAWVSQESTYVNQSILVYSYPVGPDYAMTLADLIARRDSVLRVNVPGKREGSYMYTARTLAEPTMRWVKNGKKSFVEVRGLWELHNDFMGGPFIFHAYLDQLRGRVVVVEGFVYAPKYDKRNYIRNLESIIYTFDWAK